MMGNSSRSNARPAGHPATSISSHWRSDCPSACRCRKWRTISSAASVVPGMTNSNGRYRRGRMRECQGSLANIRDGDHAVSETLIGLA